MDDELNDLSGTDYDVDDEGKDLNFMYDQASQLRLQENLKSALDNTNWAISFYAHYSFYSLLL